MKDFLEMRKKLIKTYPGHFNRMTGRTTARALAAISYAMSNPDHPVKIMTYERATGKEGTYTNHNPGHPARVEFFYKILDLLKMLELEGFSVDKRNYAITYSLGQTKGSSNG